MNSASFYLPGHAKLSGSCENTTLKNDSEAMISLSFDQIKFEWTFDVKKDYSWSTVNMTFFGNVNSSHFHNPAGMALK